MADLRQLIETLKTEQMKIWAGALPSYRETVRCQVGLCADVRESLSQEERAELIRKKAEGWNDCARRLQHLEVTIATLEHLAGGGKEHFPS